MSFEQLVQIAQLGAIPMLTVAVVQLWNRLNTVTDRFTEYLQSRADDGDPAAQRMLNDDR